MQTIHKYLVPVGAGPTTLAIPRAAKIIHVAAQNEKLCFWAQVQTTHPTERRTFAVYATGQQLPLAATYLGTAHFQDGRFVFHLLEVEI